MNPFRLLVSELLAGIHILLVEDNEINRQVCRELLERIGIEVSMAENGEMAVRKVRKQQYDCILMDVHMPVMDGLTATRIRWYIHPDSRRSAGLHYYPEVAEMVSLVFHQNRPSDLCPPPARRCGGNEPGRRCSSRLPHPKYIQTTTFSSLIRLCREPTKGLANHCLKSSATFHTGRFRTPCLTGYSASNRRESSYREQLD